MVRIGLSVEGTTEERFVKLVLAPYLSSKQIHVTARPMGGNVKLDRVRAEVKKIADSFDRVSTFYDFYGFKGKSANETKGTLEQKMQEAVHDNVRERFIPYIQMHEFESLLFSTPQAIATNLGDESLVQWAATILADFDDNPEQINDSTETAPSKRLQHRTIYRKTTHGPNIAKEIDIDALREKCTGFDDWLLRLEGLAA